MGEPISVIMHTSIGSCHVTVWINLGGLVFLSTQIYVGGPTLARGYLNRPQLNRERFISIPESLREKLSGRLYKTGDWGYMLSDGSFEICGRCDTMVKIRGYSIEKQVSVKNKNQNRKCLLTQYIQQYKSNVQTKLPSVQIIKKIIYAVT